MRVELWLLETFWSWRDLLTCRYQWRQLLLLTQSRLTRYSARALKVPRHDLRIDRLEDLEVALRLLWKSWMTVLL